MTDKSKIPFYVSDNVQKLIDNGWKISGPNVWIWQSLQKDEMTIIFDTSDYVYLMKDKEDIDEGCIDKIVEKHNLL